MNLATFQRAIDKKVKQVREAELEARREYLFDFFNALVNYTPVDTGRLRSGWAIGLERNATGEPNSLDPIGQSALIQGNAKLQQMTSKDTRVFVTNNVPYAAHVNYGTSRQRPAGFVELALARFPLVAKQKLYARLSRDGALIRAN